MLTRQFKRIGIGLLVFVLCLVALVLWGMGPGNFGRMVLGVGIIYDHQPPVLPDLQKPAILIFSKSNGFRHEESIASGNPALEKLARDHGWSSFTTENAAVFNPQQLSKFSVVIWNNVNGDVLTQPQRDAFKAWLEQGGGFVGVHGSGGDFSFKWKWYVDELIGAQFIGHTLNPQFQQAHLVIEDFAHPATRNLGKEWVRSEEWYSFAKSPRAKGYHILVTLDEGSYSPRVNIPLIARQDLRMGKDHPMVWTHCVGKGRAFYSALGHQASAWSEPKFIAMMSGAISWAAGLEGPACPAAS